jgi:hypothetical protein
LASQVTVNNPDPLMTLNEYIRTVANLKVVGELSAVLF